MEKYRNSFAAFGIHVGIVIMTIVAIAVFSIDFESGKEVVLVVLLIPAYIMGGFLFLETKSGVLMSLSPYTICLIIFSAILASSGDGAIFILTLNPMGVVFVNMLPFIHNAENFQVIIYIIATIFPTSFLAVGILLKKYFYRMLKMTARLKVKD